LANQHLLSVLHSLLVQLHRGIVTLPAEPQSEPEQSSLPDIQGHRKRCSLSLGKGTEIDLLEAGKTAFPQTSQTR
jgi:hypothetical protein